MTVTAGRRRSVFANDKLPLLLMGGETRLVGVGQIGNGKSARLETKSWMLARFPLPTGLPHRRTEMRMKTVRLHPSFC
jgi:hypothetical protein